MRIIWNRNPFRFDHHFSSHEKLFSVISEIDSFDFEAIGEYFDNFDRGRDFTFIGHSKFKHIPSGLSINFCPEGVKAGHGKFPKPEGSEPGLHYVKLPSLLAMKIQAKRQKDRGDYVELIKRNTIPWQFIEQEVLPLLSSMDKKWAEILWKQAQKEDL